MSNYKPIYRPMEIVGKDEKPSGLWHYVKIGGIIEPVGYCAQNCPGHATKGEAEEHYQKYLADKENQTTLKPN